MKYLNLIRYKNLLIIAASMYLMRYAIIFPQLTNAGIKTSINEILFFLLTISVLLIAAGGNIINDYFDIKADRINKPSKIILGKSISRRKGMLYHLLLTVIGLLIAFICSYKLNNLLIFLPYLLSAFLLWIYSARYKRKSIVGNIIISFLSALAIYLPWYIENTTLHYIYQEDLITKSFIHIIILMYSYFAFTSTMIREIVKDIEDIDGDAIAGYNTLPIKYGIRASKTLCLTFCFSIAIPIIFILFRLLTWKLMIPFWYCLVAILTPLSYMVFIIQQSSEKANYTSLSIWIKVFMLSGILSAFLFR